MIADEWHELMGSKRGVQVELALSRLKTIVAGLKVWGISATIGNMDEAIQHCLGTIIRQKKFTVIKADIEKKVEVVSVLPESVEMMPWSGHLGIRLLQQVVDIVKAKYHNINFYEYKILC